MGLGGWSSLLRVGSGDGVSCGGRGRGGLAVVCVGRGININRLVEAAACCVCGLVPGGGAGGGGMGVALLVVGGAGSGVVLAGGLGVPVGLVGVACVRPAVLAAPGSLWC